MLDNLKKVRRCAYQDNKKYFDNEAIRFGIDSIELSEFKKTKLYKFTEELDDKKLRQIVLLCLVGREFSSYYGGVNKILRPIDYLIYFDKAREDLGATREDDILFLMRHRFEILNYIDRLQKIINKGDKK